MYCSHCHYISGHDEACPLAYKDAVYDQAKEILARMYELELRMERLEAQIRALAGK